MVRVDLNIISVVGLVLGAVAGVLFIVQHNVDADMRLGSYLGPDVPLAEIPLGGVILFVALITYAFGRVLWVVKHRGGMPNLPPRSDRED
ncbi:MAG: hypothetical protein ABFS86_04070 [Planctomycetota bacterium]